MKNLLFALSVLALVALGPARAQGNVSFLEFGAEGDLLSTQLVGADLYTTPVALDHDRFDIDAVPDDWERIATVSDVVLGMDGQVRGMLVDIGGFLGLGARTVMVDMASVRIAMHTGSNAVFVVIGATREDLEMAPEYVAFDRTGAARDDPATTRTGVAEPQAGFATVAWSTLTVDQLRGAAVYDINNERVADITDVVLGTGDTVQAVLIDVGGFLGIGARTVAISMDQLEIQGNEDASDLRVYLAITEAQLEALPEHDAD